MARKQNPYYGLGFIETIELFESPGIKVRNSSQPVLMRVVFSHEGCDEYGIEELARSCIPIILALFLATGIDEELIPRESTVDKEQGALLFFHPDRPGELKTVHYNLLSRFMHALQVEAYQNIHIREYRLPSVEQYSLFAAGA